MNTLSPRLAGEGGLRHNVQLSLQVLQDLGFRSLRVPPQQLIQSLP
jgi:hypothetical protein